MITLELESKLKKKVQSRKSRVQTRTFVFHHVLFWCTSGRNHKYVWSVRIVRYPKPDLSQKFLDPAKVPSATAIVSATRFQVFVYQKLTHISVAYSRASIKGAQA
jgi:hypothetical protein